MATDADIFEFGPFRLDRRRRVLWRAGSLEARVFPALVFVRPVQEDLSGIAVVKNYALEEARGRAFAERSRRYVARSMAVARARGVLTPVTGLVGGLGTVIALLFGGRMVISGRITLGDLVAPLSRAGGAR